MSYLLKEDGDKILLETGDGILLDTLGSPSASISASMSPSSSISPSSSFSASISPSSSESSSVSPSSSTSPSSSESASISPSSSESPSISPSASLSPSSSVSPSASLSPSTSISASISPSPSPGTKDYTKGDYAALPGDDTDLETNYTDQEKTDVETKNDVRVDQDAVSEYAIHQFKEFAGTETKVTLEWEGQTTEAPSGSTVFLQIYNHNTTTWDTVVSDNTSSANTDFTLRGGVADLTNYKDGSNVISCRIYQLAI